MQKTPSRTELRVGGKTTFLWQGVLIVLPALLLAGVGFFSLRQDRILAQHEATEEAKKIARNLAEVVLPGVLKIETVTREAIDRFRASPTQPEHDPIQAVASMNGPVVACVLSRTGELLYPPPASGLPNPRPVEPSALTGEQQTIWDSLQAATLASGDWAAATNLTEQFLATQPPEPFSALAQYQVATLFGKAGQFDEARIRLEKLVREHPDAVGESGFPLKVFAELRSLQLASSPPGRGGGVGKLPESILASLCSGAVVQPSPLSPLLLAKAAEAEAVFTPAGHPGRVSDNWQRVWELHEAARDLFLEISRDKSGRRWNASLPRLNSNGLPQDGNGAESNSTAQAPKSALVGRTTVATTGEPAAAPGEDSSFWLSLKKGASDTDSEMVADDLDDLLLISETQDEATWWFAWPEAKVREALHRVLQAQVWPAYFGISIVVADRALADSGAASPTLATAVGRAAGMPALEVSVHLTDAAALYARQRMRTVWFGSLIGLSTGAVMFGFLAAWRAFRRQQQLNELKSNFVSSVSHEIRAPIASVRLMAEELEEIGVHDRQKSKEYHRFIVQECRRLSAMIENVLDFSRIEQGRKQFQFEPTDVVALVEETTKLMQPYAAEREVLLELRAQIPQPSTLDPQPTLDARAIQQVLVNLIDNAIKHSPKGAAVTVGLEFVFCDPTRPSAPPRRGTGNQPAERSSPPSEGQRDGSQHLESSPSQGRELRITHYALRFTPYSLRSTPHVSHFSLWVEDQGEGIPSEEHDRIFERFYRLGSELRRETQGVGLGLAIVKYIVEAHGGRVTVRSDVGQGSRFTVDLPLEPAHWEPRLDP
ncbi:MAG: hypothetical protein HY735_02460 [Verrucomicrobia bacterium]|nr:hypothetical protein [Verrucomicrobiota bacterium]